MRDYKDLKREPVTVREFRSKLGAALFWIACGVAGFCIPTAVAGWLGWLDPILK